MTEPPILRFARDFSGDDPKIVKKVKEYLTNPPASIDEIGYYGWEDYPADARLWLATVSRLDEGEHLFPCGDKFATECAAVWEREGQIDLSQLSPAARLVFGEPAIDPNDDQRIKQFQTDLRTFFPAAVREMEQHVAARGKVLVQVDDPGGETMQFAFASTDVAARWKDKAFAVNGAKQYGVRSPDWARFWDQMIYSLELRFRDSDWDGLTPVGLPDYRETLPLAE